MRVKIRVLQVGSSEVLTDLLESSLLQLPCSFSMYWSFLRCLYPDSDLVASDGQGKSMQYANGGSCSIAVIG